MKKTRRGSSKPAILPENQSRLSFGAPKTIEKREKTQEEASNSRALLEINENSNPEGSNSRILPERKARCNMESLIQKIRDSDGQSAENSNEDQEFTEVHLKKRKHASKKKGRKVEDDFEESEEEFMEEKGLLGRNPEDFDEEFGEVMVLGKLPDTIGELTKLKQVVADKRNMYRAKFLEEIKFMQSKPNQNQLRNFKGVLWLGNRK